MEDKLKVSRRNNCTKSIIGNFESIDAIKEKPQRFKEHYKKISKIYDELPYIIRPKIRYLRESLGLTREHPEEKSYISAQTIKQIETNEERVYTVEILIALCVEMNNFCSVFLSNQSLLVV